MLTPTSKVCCIVSKNFLSLY